MRDPGTFETRLARALRQYAVRARRETDPLALARQILHEPSEARVGPRHRWSSDRPDLGPAAQGRFRPMSSATKLVAAGAILALAVAGVGGVLGPLDPTAEAPSPSPTPAATPLVVGEGSAFFTGTITFNGREVPQPGLSDTTFEQNGLLVTTGEPCLAGQAMTTSDPRIGGSRTICVSSVTEDGTDNGMDRALARISNDDGAWTCDLTWVYLRDATDRRLASASGPCEGSGGYAGLKADIVFQGTDVFGFINAGDGPPKPVLPEP